MKKLFFILAFLTIAVKSLTAQMVVDAEMFKSNPSQFMGKVVTIKNVVYKGSSITPGSPNGGVVSPDGKSAGSSSGAPVGVAGPSSGKSASAYCNPDPKLTLTKWTLGPNNDLCLQVNDQVKPAILSITTGRAVKSISFRVTPTMYLATRIEP